MPPAPDPAARRFAIISAVRLAGVAVLLAGIAALADVWAVPDATGIALLLLGGVGTFLVPTLLARRWSSRRQR